MNDKPLKSALEIAMERLKQKDADAGVETRPLTDEQRTSIAEIRSYYEAKIAEIDVLHESALRRTWDPGERDTLQQQHRRERERLTSERDAKIENIRTPAR